MAEESKELTVYDLLDRTNKEKPKQEDIKALRRYLAEHPDAWRAAGDLVRQNIELLIRSVHLTPAAAESLVTGLAETSKALGYDQSPMIEKLLIEQLLVSKVHLDFTTHQYTRVAYAGTNTITLVEHWERRVNSAQARYTRAVEALARVRKMQLPVMQVNIAQEGSQQLNVAGNLKKG